MDAIYIFAVCLYGQPKITRFTVVTDSLVEANRQVTDYIAEHTGGFAELIDVR